MFPHKMYVLSSQGQQFLREWERNVPDDEPLANGSDDKPMDDTTFKPVHTKPLEHSGEPKPKPAIKTRRGFGRKNKEKNYSKNVSFSLLGTNSAGLNPKK